MVREVTRTAPTVEIISEGEPITADTYSVILHNDDVTPTPLVLVVLHETFQLDTRTAIDKILEAEATGMSRVASGCSFIQADEKVTEATNICRKVGYELVFTIEED